MDRLISKELEKKAATFFENPITAVVDPVKGFAVESYRLISKCTKPDGKEFQDIVYATTIGFLVMGFVGFFVKMIHIPINNILVRCAVE